MAKMTDDQIGDAIDSARETILLLPAMSPSHASQQDSVDFLDGLIRELEDTKATIRMEMNDEDGDGL